MKIALILNQESLLQEKKTFVRGGDGEGKKEIPWELQFLIFLLQVHQLEYGLSEESLVVFWRMFHLDPIPN